MRKYISRVNRVIVYLTVSDIFSWGILGALGTLEGIYLAERLGGDVARYVGVGVAISFSVRALLQIPIGLLTDKIKEDVDEIVLLFAGSFLMGLPFLFYPLIESQYLYYFLQGILGVGMALNLVSWRKLFALHLDKGKEGLEYGVYDTLIATCTAMFGMIMGLVASLGENYFDAVMVAIAIIVMSGSLWAVMIYKFEQNVQHSHTID